MRSPNLGTADSRRTKQEQSQTCLNFALQGGGRRSQLPCPMLYWTWLFVVEGINDGVVKESVRSLHLLEKRKISVKYCSGRL